MNQEEQHAANERKWSRDNRGVEHYHIQRKEFAHGEMGNMRPDDTEDYGRAGGYTGRDIESSVGYQESYRDLDIGHGVGFDETQWRQGIKKTSHKGKGPKNYKRSDERIAEDVNERLFLDPHVDATDIEVTVNNGEVQLKGSVEDREQKRRAEDIIADVPGVQHIDNLLRIERYTTHSPR
jgi:hypothetical protein